MSKEEAGNARVPANRDAFGERKGRKEGVLRRLGVQSRSRKYVWAEPQWHGSPAPHTFPGRFPLPWRQRFRVTSCLGWAGLPET